MQIQVYHSDNFLNSKSEIYQLEDDVGHPEVDNSETTLKKLYKKGWVLKQAIKVEDPAKKKNNTYIFFLEKV